MYKLNYVLAALIIAGFALSGCSKKGNDRMLGKWKAEEFEDTTYKSMGIMVTYEFTKDKIINEGFIHGDTLPKMEINYVVKDTAIGGDTIVLEATHPQSQQKGLFKIKFDGDKMKLVDPGNTRMTLIKQ